MKYSHKCVDKALLIVLPNSDKWPNSIQRPTRLDMAVKQLFLYPENFTTTDHYFSHLVIKTALLELTTLGQINFGDVDEFWA